MLIHLCDSPENCSIIVLVNSILLSYLNVSNMYQHHLIDGLMKLMNPELFH